MGLKVKKPRRKVAGVSFTVDEHGRAVVLMPVFLGYVEVQPTRRQLDQMIAALEAIRPWAR